MKILKIKSSITQEKSHSNKMVDFIANQIKYTYALEYDLNTFNIPTLNSTLLQDIQLNRKSHEKDVCDRLITDLKNVNTLIIGAPMYSFTYPVQLKKYFDAVARQGETFKYCSVEQKPIGLSNVKNAFVVLSRGGIFNKEEFSAVEDSIEKYLKFIGVENIHMIYMHGMSMGQKSVDRYTKEAKEQVMKIIHGDK